MAGLFVHGMPDLDEMLLDWGASVSRLGLAEAFGINYGVVSYGFFGPVFEGGEFVPRFWWAPYKLLVLAFDVAVLVVLLRFVGRRAEVAVLFLYWLNPWFILHEGWQGFWEAPHILAGLLAVLVIHRLGDRTTGWLAVGALLGVSAMIKPQGLMYFVGPVGLVLVVLAAHQRAWRRLGAYTAGVAGALLLTALWVVSIGGTPVQLVANYGTAFTVMPSVSNGGPGIWRALTHLYMVGTGQNGHVSTVRLDGTTLALATEIAGIVCLTLLTLFALRLRQAGTGTPRSWGWTLLTTLTLGSLVMSQFGVRAHINHTYTAMVVAVPLAYRYPDIRRSWTAMAVLLGVCHLLLYGVGQAVLLPSPHDGATYPYAQDLVARVAALPAFARPDAILTLQAAVNRVVFALPGEWLVSLLSPLVFVVAIVMTRDLFGVARQHASGQAANG